MTKQSRVRKLNSSNKNDLYTNNKTEQEINNFTSPRMEVYRVASVATTLRMHDEFRNICNGSRNFKGTFSLQDENDAKPYQVHDICTPGATQERSRKTIRT